MTNVIYVIPTLQCASCSKYSTTFYLSDMIKRCAVRNNAVFPISRQMKTNSFPTFYNDSLSFTFASYRRFPVPFQRYIVTTMVNTGQQIQPFWKFLWYVNKTVYIVDLLWKVLTLPFFYDFLIVFRFWILDMPCLRIRLRTFTAALVIIRNILFDLIFSFCARAGIVIFTFLGVQFSFPMLTVGKVTTNFQQLYNYNNSFMKHSVPIRLFVCSVT